MLKEEWGNIDWSILLKAWIIVLKTVLCSWLEMKAIIFCEMTVLFSEIIIWVEFYYFVDNFVMMKNLILLILKIKFQIFILKIDSLCMWMYVSKNLQNKWWQKRLLSWLIMKTSIKDLQFLIWGQNRD